MAAYPGDIRSTVIGIHEPSARVKLFGQGVSGWKRGTLENDMGVEPLVTYACVGSRRTGTHVTAELYEDMIGLLWDEFGINPLVSHWNKDHYTITLDKGAMERLQERGLGRDCGGQLLDINDAPVRLRSGQGR